MATIKAFIRSTSKSKIVKIRLRLTDGRDFTRYGVTSIELPADLWDAKREEIKGRAILPENIDRDAVNGSIEEAKQKVLLKYREIENKELIGSDWIDTVLSDCMSSN